jgi:GrpB-like predicted nucleotidyltransferase (UPF0157 family)
VTVGLAYGEVALEPHSAEWARSFEAERARLAPVLAHLPHQIEHIGSTSVPGLIAKPIVDIAVGASDPRELPTFVKLIEGVGYIFRGDKGSQGGLLLVNESRPWFRTHHLHLVAISDPEWEKYLRFRALLRRSAEARARYTAAKQELARAHPIDRSAYTFGKDEIVCALLAKGEEDDSEDPAPRDRS